MDKPYHRFVLGNGMKVLIVPRGGELIHVELQMKNGRVSEQPHQYEFTHAAEHLFAMFTSSKHPRFKTVNRTLARKGAKSNAYTGDYVTGYFIRGCVEDYSYFLDLLSHMFFDFQYDPSVDFEKQRNIVLAELKTRYNDTWSRLYNDRDKILYPNHSLSYTWEEGIANMSRAVLEDVIAYNKAKMDPQIAILKISGGGWKSLKDLKRDVVRMFDRAPGKHVKRFHFETPPVYCAPSKGDNVHVVNVPQTLSSRLLLQWQTPLDDFNLRAKARVEFMLAVLAKGYFSCLSQLLREKHGLIYGIRSAAETNEQHPDASHVVLMMDTDPENVARVTELTMKEIQRIKDHLISDEDFERVRNDLITSQRGEVYSTALGKWTDFYGHFWLWGHEIVSYQSWFNTLKSVTRQDVQRAAREVFQSNRLIVMVGGNESNGLK